MDSAGSEVALLTRARAGDEDAFAALVTLHAARLYAALRQFGLDAAEAEDVAQEVFLRAWRGLKRFQGRAQFSTWLYRIAFNEAQRRMSRRPPVPVSAAQSHEDPVTALPQATGLGPEAQALDHEFTAILERALRELPSDWRAAVVLRDIHGLSTEAAAEVVGIRQLSFKSRLHRGRMQLRALLAPYLELDRS
ncbi:MAG: polymerase sigma-70 factor, subfamily [Solirubrobacteraceae bacterium]|jgi:RNA polymerase sigma-70 factor (ECF subfamily)|nr:polymerase sigma-70 factor, subfamily [Solirubrobacteraceae bacterium]